MAWQTFTITNVRLSPAEKAAFEAIQGSTSVGAEIVTNVIAEFRGAIEAAGGALGSAGTIPDLLRIHAINRVRWLWLTEFPQLKTLQTAAREKLNQAAEDMINAIASGEQRVAPSTASTNASGSWNSENKFKSRSHPIPRPGPQSTDGYANPTAPSDQSAS
jgi:hypothetical protein